jgi:hypothetical protein
VRLDQLPLSSASNTARSGATRNQIVLIGPRGRRW